jgi:hypothetical protein
MPISEASVVEPLLPLTVAEVRDGISTLQTWRLMNNKWWEPTQNAKYVELVRTFLGRIDPSQWANSQDFPYVGMVPPLLEHMIGCCNAFVCGDGADKQRMGHAQALMRGLELLSAALTPLAPYC